MIYTTLLLIGAIGLFAQGLFGLGHGHAHGVHVSHAGRSAHSGAHGGHMLSALWTALSPLTIFSLCLGVGATGLLLHPEHWASRVTALAAIVGGLLFYLLLIRPMWGLLFRFASKPGAALEGTIAEECEALGRFDAQGRGMVKLSIDGQRVRVLAFLEQSDRAQAVVPGEHLTVIGVDPHANTCRVARL